jgi:hypothetical protein
MSAKPISHRSVKVSKGNSHLTVYPWHHPATGKLRWRFAWRTQENQPWAYVTRQTKAAAISAAELKLDELDQGGLIWSALAPARRRFLEAIHHHATAADEDALLAFLTSRHSSAEVTASVAKFLAWKIATKGEETRNLANVRRILDPMASHFAGQLISDITADALVAWWTTRCQGLGKKTSNEVRGALVAFWNWCIWEKIYPKEVTPAERIPRQELDEHERRVLTPAEFTALAAHISLPFRPALVLGAFAGMRPEEIAPPTRKGMSKKGKRGLHREEIDWQFSVINVPSEVSKTKTPRKIPLLPGTRNWLEWAGIRPGQTGPVCPQNPSEAGETTRLGKLVFPNEGWPQDALRHSYGSYRNAIIRSLPQVAEEMGNSEAMLKRHYHNPKNREEGEAWFNLTPLTVPICSDGNEVTAQEYLKAAKRKH